MKIVIQKSFFEVDVKYPEQLNKSRNNFPCLLDRMRVNKCEKRVCNLKNQKIISCTHKNFKTSTKLQEVLQEVIEQLNLIKKIGKKFVKM